MRRLGVRHPIKESACVPRQIRIREIVLTQDNLSVKKILLCMVPVHTLQLNVSVAKETLGNRATHRRDL